MVTKPSLRPGPTRTDHCTATSSDSWLLKTSGSGRMKGREQTPWTRVVLVIAALCTPGCESRCSGFQCQDGSCVSRSCYCDNKPDCADDSDESLCECASGRYPKMYECDNRECIASVDMQCDGKKQCKDGSDEAYCHTSPKVSTKHNSTKATATTPTKTTSDASPQPHHHKLMWVTMGTVLGGVAILSCLTLVLICAAVIVTSVRRYKDGRNHPLLLRYDSAAPGNKQGDRDENEEDEEGENVYETMTLLDHPPTYQEINKIKQ